MHPERIRVLTSHVSALTSYLFSLTPDISLTSCTSHLMSYTLTIHTSHLTFQRQLSLSHRQTSWRPAWSPPSCWGGQTVEPEGRPPRRWLWSQTGGLRERKGQTGNTWLRPGWTDPSRDTPGRVPHSPPACSPAPSGCRRHCSGQTAITNIMCHVVQTVKSRLCCPDCLIQTSRPQPASYMTKLNLIGFWLVMLRWVILFPLEKGMELRK